MKNRYARKRRKPGSRQNSNRPETPPSSGQTRWFWSRYIWLIAALTPIVGLAVVLWIRSNSASTSPEPAPAKKERRVADTEKPPVPTPGAPSPHGPAHPPVHSLPKEAGPKSEPGNFLEAFNDPGSGQKDNHTEGIPSNEELERHFEDLAEVYDEFNTLKARALTPGVIKNEKEFAKVQAERDRLVKQINEKSASLEKEVALARQAREEDPMPRWLAGELLKLVGGEPEQIRPHLEYALSHGLKRPRLLASLARVQLETNEFAEAYKNAVAALAQGSKSHDIWEVFNRVAISMHQFTEVIERLDRAFPSQPPGWVVAMRDRAMELQTAWQAEQKIREAEARANDLPRVKLVIEHRRFARGDEQKATVESTGQEEVILELFEDQAPATVANFLSLVDRGFYDDTLFHVVVPATMAVGGDPNTKNNDPSDDGAGVRDYVIPDEYLSPAARKHFRGSLSMVSTGPHTAFSRFFLTLTPQPAMNGHCTVFGRVIKGMEAVDRISRGRTTRNVGTFGKIIPGDRLVRATVLRKRPHEYEVIKEKP
jgi:cyclophilin family peptidyl-prolyl cis-trans isomerase